MTRALVIEPSGNLWGSERALLDLLGAVPMLEVAVCCPPAVPLNRELEKLHIRTLPYYIYGLHEKSKRYRLQAAAGVIRACREFRPDVLYLNQCGCYKVALPAATLLRLPIVAHIRIFEDAAYLARQSPDPRRLRGIVAISSAVETEIRRFQQLDSIQLHRIYDAYAPAVPALQNSCLPERIVNRVACVGRLVPVKGQDVLVGALRILKDFECGLECLFVGDGEESFVKELRERAVFGKTASIRWLGFVGDVFSLLRTCSVLVCPSHSEPLGRVIFESWDAGALPIVFAGSGGAAEIVAAAEGGILYHEQTPQSLAMALRKALELDGEQRNKLVHNGRRWMSTNCNSEAYGQTILTILKNAASKSIRVDGLRR
ncbi:MAG: glycosyltransferase family 4 protein [Candidatus Sulfotelmatobacter sp.]